MNRVIFFALSAATLFPMLAAGAIATSSWENVPRKNHTQVNPLAGDSKAIAGGAALYREHCAQCHGDHAEGDGKKKPSLKTERVRTATDGDLEWFLRQGDLQHGMPSWSKLPKEQRWLIVSYLRSLQQ